ncbi:MAG: hypothetical protein IIA58_01505 [Candidatus Marinimicrobia bacterium]|nr:hypothetical protein [Candidatus Neomarinimicrobiota bacterium]
MNQHRINSMLGESVGDFNGRGFFLADVREAILSVTGTHEELRLYIESARREGSLFGPRKHKPNPDDGGERLNEEDDNDPKRSTSFRHFVGITEIQANLLIGILNTSRAIQQESLEIWRRFIRTRFNSSGILPGTSLPAGGSDISGTNLPAIEINNIFNGEINLADSAQLTEVAEDLANETIAQLRAAGLRI